MGKPRRRKLSGKLMACQTERRREGRGGERERGKKGEGGKEGGIESGREREEGTEGGRVR